MSPLKLCSTGKHHISFQQSLFCSSKFCKRTAWLSKSLQHMQSHSTCCCLQCLPHILGRFLLYLHGMTAWHRIWLPQFNFQSSKSGVLKWQAVPPQVGHVIRPCLTNGGGWQDSGPVHVHHFRGGPLEGTPLLPGRGRTATECEQQLASNVTPGNPLPHGSATFFLLSLLGLRLAMSRSCTALRQ